MGPRLHRPWSHGRDHDKDCIHVMALDDEVGLLQSAEQTPEDRTYACMGGEAVQLPGQAFGGAAAGARLCCSFREKLLLGFRV